MNVVLHRVFKQSFLGAALLLASCVGTKAIDAPSIAGLASDQWLLSDSHQPVRFAAINESAQLDQLIDEALRNNLDLSAAKWRVDAAQRGAAAANGSRWPSISASLSQQESDQGAMRTTTASGDISLSWEIDVWGRVAAGALEATAGAEQQQQLYRAAQYSLAGDVARLWFDVIEAKAQLYLSKQQRSNFTQNLAIIRDGFTVGIRPAFDVYSAEAELQSFVATVSQREQTLNNRLRNLSILLGRSASVDWDVPQHMPQLAAAIPPTLNSSIVMARPDVQAATQALAVQQARLGLAKANRLPRFNLTASTGAASDTLGDVLSGNESVWRLLGGVTQPLFQGGRLRAEQQRQALLLNAEIDSYKHTVLRAFTEVEQRLDDEQQLARQVRAVAESVRMSSLAEEQALEQYVSGISNLNTWLQAQRTAFSRQSNLLQLQTALLKNRIALYLAIGGDFDGDRQS